jgi:hypothetical protein
VDYYQDIWRIINRSSVSTGYDRDGNVVTRDAGRFKGLSYERQQRINEILDHEQYRQRSLLTGEEPESLKTVKERSGKLVPLIVNNYKTSQPLTASVQDAIMNPQTASGIPGQDPNTFAFSIPNLWLSPQEAASVYSQKGIPEIIIRKKSSSILLNGVRVKNPRLTPEQLDKVRENLEKLSIPNHLADATRDSLTYGGSLMFPVFKKDSPLTMHLPVWTLIKHGIVGKGCVERMVVLDRWNTVHIPNWNPTSDDFREPKQYFIPMLGTHVAGDRCARIVTAPQPGYWGAIPTMGWGISDIVGWIESVYNYYNVMQAVPTMINQMSILARTFNVDGVLATEGANILDDLVKRDTIRVRQMSVNNPVSLDVIGTLQAIQRDFSEVPNLIRLIRQDFCARAVIPEELVLSSERGSFSSGDTTEGAMERQWEGVKYIHRDVAYQSKKLAMLLVIDALGLDREVIRALPYTTIEFDNPVIANAEIRSEIAENLGKCAFDLISSGVPADAAMQIVSSYGDDEFSVRSNLLEDLRNRQAVLDKRAEEEHEKNMELLDAEIEQTREQAKHVGEGAGGFAGAGAPKREKGGGYSRLEQHQKEKTRGTAARREALQKAAAKKVT